VLSSGHTEGCSTVTGHKESPDGTRLMCVFSISPLITPHSQKELEDATKSGKLLS